MPDLQAEDPPDKRQILPRLLVQEGHLLHVWYQNPQNQKLQAGLYLKKDTELQVITVLKIIVQVRSFF